MTRSSPSFVCAAGPIRQALTLSHATSRRPHSRRRLLPGLALSLAAVLPLPGLAADAAQPPAPATPAFAWGGDLRARNEYLRDAVCLTDTDALRDQDLIRYRARAWVRATPASDLQFNLRLASEPREWLKPAFASAYKARDGVEWRFLLADALNVKWERAFNLPLTVTVGRQDILPGELGDGWLVGDGTPADGSMTMYFDALRLKFAPTALKTDFNVIVTANDARPDAWLPTLGDSSSYPMAEQREQGVILYASNRSVENLRVDGYFLYKHDRQQTYTIAGARKTPGDNAELYTVGGRLSGTPAAHWQYTLEAAAQFGWKQDRIQAVFASRDVAAYGAQAKLTYLLKDAWASQLSLTGECLSGDKPGTAGRDEMFDVLWGRWPSWSDGYIYSMIPETNGRPAQMNNLARLGLAAQTTPLKPLTLGLTYSALFAPEATATRALVGSFSNTGHFRGHYVQGLIKYQFTKTLTGTLQAEWISEGNYYRQRDGIVYGKVELLYRF